VRDFWISSGHHLLDRDRAGRLLVTDSFLKAYLARPELLPPEDACAAERRLHHELLVHDPRRPIGSETIAAIGHADARENWALMIAFRDRLIEAASLEEAYLALVCGKAEGTPPLFVNQLAQLVLRNALDGASDPVVLRAGELFYRPQRVTFHEGAVLLADAESIERHERDRCGSPLVDMLSGPAVTALDILNATNADTYFARSDAFDMVLSLGGGEARRGLASAMEAWVRHLVSIEVEIEPVERIEDESWSWFVGLDTEATRIGNALWHGRALDEGASERIMALFRLSFTDPADAQAEFGARPVWLILAMASDWTIRMKPQNLALGLPLRVHVPASGRV
jgi:hypothetical protein